MTDSASKHPAPETLLLVAPPGSIDWRQEGDIARLYGGVGPRHGRMSLDHLGITVTRNDGSQLFVVHDRSSKPGDPPPAEGGDTPTSGAPKPHPHRAVVVPFDRAFHAGELMPDREHVLMIDFDPATKELKVTIARGKFGETTRWFRTFTGFLPETHPNPHENHGKVTSSADVLKHDHDQATKARGDRGEDTHWRLPPRVPTTPQACMPDPANGAASAGGAPASPPDASPVGVHPTEGEGAPTDGAEN